MAEEEGTGIINPFEEEGKIESTQSSPSPVVEEESRDELLTYDDHNQSSANGEEEREGEDDSSNLGSNSPNDLPIETQLQINDNETTPSDDLQPAAQERDTIKTTPIEDEPAEMIETAPTLTNPDKENTKATPPSKKKPTKRLTPQLRSQSSPAVQVPSKRPSTTPSSGERRKNSTKKTFKPTVPKPFNFALNQRLEERSDYEKRMKMMREEMEEKEKQQKEQREREEAEELKSIRKTLVHKARPIQYYDPITIVPSEKPLTVPEPPNLVLGHRNRSVGDKTT